jgi:hypothetical protein
MMSVTTFAVVVLAASIVPAAVAAWVSDEEILEHKACRVLGLPEHEVPYAKVRSNFRKWTRAVHPDMLASADAAPTQPNGAVVTMRAVNNAHEMLRSIAEKYDGGVCCALAKGEVYDPTAGGTRTPWQHPNFRRHDNHQQKKQPPPTDVTRSSRQRAGGGSQNDRHDRSGGNERWQNRNDNNHRQRQQQGEQAPPPPPRQKRARISRCGSA